MVNPPATVFFTGTITVFFGHHRRTVMDQHLTTSRQRVINRS